MSRWTLPGWKAFTAPIYAGSPSEVQLFREVPCVPFVVAPGQQFGGISFAYRTEQGTPENQSACPPPGTLARMWIANRFGEIIAHFGPIPIENKLNFFAVSIPFPWPWSPEPDLYHAMISCTIPSGDAYTGLLVRSCYGLIPPVDGQAVAAGLLPALVGQRRFEYESNPALDDLGSSWPPLETMLEAQQLPLITFEET